MAKKPPPALRPESIWELLRAVARASLSERLSRNDLVRQTGLAPATVGRGLRLLSHLEDARETRKEQPVLLFDTHGGLTRRAEYVRLNPEAGYAAAVEFSHRRLIVGVADLSGRIQNWTMSDKSEVDTKPHESIDKGAVMLTDLLRDREITNLVGVGVAVAAPVEPTRAGQDRSYARSGVVRALKGETEETPATWVGLDPADELRRRLRNWNSPFELGNDANFAALGEFQWARERWTGREPLKDLLHLKWSSGIGCGVIINGRLHTGSGGLAGEIGHTAVPGLSIDPPRRCKRCGRDNCLETFASYEAMRNELGLEGLTRAQFDANERGRQLIIARAELLGRCLGPLISAFNPQLLIVSGPSPPLQSSLVPAIRRGLHEAAAPATATDVQVQIAESRWHDLEPADDVGRLAVVSGATSRVLEQHVAGYLLRRFDLDLPVHQPERLVLAG